MIYESTVIHVGHVKEFDYEQVVDVCPYIDEW